MKRFYTLLSLFLISTALMAQVNVTLKVDITKYLEAGTALGANGIRIGGDFDVTGAMNGDNAMAVWSPSDPTCAMTDMGSNVWAITITFPAASIGLTQQFKFVNNDWGTNEGTDAANTIASGGCGTDDGGGNINRTLVVPSENLILQYCWDACLRCNGGDADITGIQTRESFSGIAIFPNPVDKIASISLNLNKPSDVEILILNSAGQEFVSVKNINEPAGYRTFNLDVSKIPSGVYICRVIAGDKIAAGSIVKL